MPEEEEEKKQPQVVVTAATITGAGIGEEKEMDDHDHEKDHEEADDWKEKVASVSASRRRVGCLPADESAAHFLHCLHFSRLSLSLFHLFVLRVVFDSILCFKKGNLTPMESGKGCHR